MNWPAQYFVGNKLSRYAIIIIIRVFFFNNMKCEMSVNRDFLFTMRTTFS